jgi:hypothetical protein
MFISNNAKLKIQNAKSRFAKLCKLCAFANFALNKNFAERETAKDAKKRKERKGK